MQKSWAISVPGLDLLVELDPGLGRRAALEPGLRQAIRSGRLQPGTRLPSSRTLAHDVGLARGTVSEAYRQLVTEGYLAARQGGRARPSLTALADHPPGSCPPHRPTGSGWTSAPASPT